MAGKTRRYDRGNTHYYTLDGVRVPSVTEIIDTAMPKPWMGSWTTKVIGDFLAYHNGAPLVEAIGVWAAENNVKFDGTLSDAVRLLRKLPDWERDQAAARGRLVHECVESMVALNDVEVPDEHVAYVDSFLDWVRDFDPVFVLSEFVVFSREYQYAGTADLLVRFEPLGLTLLDIKTGRSGVHPEHALQLGAYQRAAFYLDANGNEVPMPEVDSAAVLWLRPDRYELTPVNTQAWDQFLRCLMTYEWLKEAENLIGEPVRKGSAA